MNGQYNDSCTWNGFHYPTGCRNSVQNRHRDIHDCDVGFQFFNRSKQSASISHRVNDIKLKFQQLPNAFQDFLIVIG